MRAKALAKCALVAALLVVLTILLVAAATGYRCFLDVLNGAIERQCEFRPYYAGTGDTPRPREVIPELGDLEDAFPAIQSEMLAVLKDRERIPVMQDAYNNIFVYKEVPSQALAKGGTSEYRKTPRSLLYLARLAERFATKLIYGKDTEVFNTIGSPDWQTFNLVMFDQDVPCNAARCPTTVALLRRVPGMQSALFSILAPGARIPPHHDPSKGVIRYHLALQVPKDRDRCFISVAGQKYHWEEGKGVLLEDAFEHWAQNDSDEDRVVLFVDILRPLTGIPKALQAAANFANRYNPGVRRAIRASVVASEN